MIKNAFQCTASAGAGMDYLSFLTAICFCIQCIHFISIGMFISIEFVVMYVCPFASFKSLFFILRKNNSFYNSSKAVIQNYNFISDQFL